jgi:hypothetical protein
MIRQTEAVVVDPDRDALVRDLRQTLAEAWYEVQAGVDRAADTVDVDSAARRPQRADVEDQHAADVHVTALVLDTEERRIECA